MKRRSSSRRRVRHRGRSAAAGHGIAFLISDLHIAVGVSLPGLFLAHILIGRRNR
jgi:hypothetical protein